MDKSHQKKSSIDETYFVENPSISSKPGFVKLKLPNKIIELKTDRGTFSYKKLDAGTAVFLKNIQDPSIEGDLLDLGCGYGPISIFLAQKYPNRIIWAIDVNSRSLDLLKTNIQNLGIENIKTSKPEDLNIKSFAAIYSNPPIRIGKKALQELLLKWLKLLSQNGEAYFVIKRNLGADSIMDFLNKNGFYTERFKSKNGYRILKVTKK